jgi:TonB family protein
MKRWFLIVTLYFALFSGCQTVPQQPTATATGAAVDAAGMRHNATEYPKQHVPWIEDLLQTVEPEYPYQERGMRHEGAGRFRVTLDLRSGRVLTVSVLQSTGFKPLDESAVTALSQWRWEPGRWKQVDIPVRFKMGLRPTGSTPLPHS